MRLGKDSACEEATFAIACPIIEPSMGLMLWEQRQSEVFNVRFFKYAESASATTS